MKITINVIQAAPNSIYLCLKKKLGREPSSSEIRAEVKRIIHSAKPERSSRRSQ